MQNNAHIHLICILNGAKKLTMSLSQILQDKNIPHDISYIKTHSTSETNLLDEVILEQNNIPMSDAFCQKTYHIIVDDLIDSGKTVIEVKKYLQTKGYANIKILALINKYKNSNIADIVGYDLEYVKSDLHKENIKDYWLFGYGMDLNEEYRELDEIKALKLKL